MLNKTLTKYDSDYIEIIGNEFQINKDFKRVQLFTNNYIRNELRKYIDLDLNCKINADLSQYFRKSESEDQYVCKDCLLRDKNQLDFFRHILTHFWEYIGDDCVISSEIQSNVRQSPRIRPMDSRQSVVNQEVVDLENDDNEWQVLDEWRSRKDCDVIELTDDSSNCSEALRRLSSSSELSSDDLSENEPKNKKNKNCGENDSIAFKCFWLDCNKTYSHRNCYSKHMDNHLVDENGKKWEQSIKDFSKSYFSFDYIKNYSKSVEQNGIKKYFCKYKDCSFDTNWSYQLAIHIRTEHTLLWPPFRCDWGVCRTIVPSKDAFAHRITHYVEIQDKKPNN